MSKQKKHLPKIILGLILIIGIIYGFNKYQYVSTHEDTDNAQIEAYFVPVLPRISGYVKSVNVNDYDVVKKGQVLVEIDVEEGKLALEELEADLDQAKTEVENAKANLTSFEKSIQAQKSQVNIAKQQKEKTQRDLAHYYELEKEKAITHQQYLEIKDLAELAEIKLQGAIAELNSSQSKHGILIAGLHRAEALIRVKNVKIAQQKLKLSYANITAPQNGKIGKKSVEPGQFIQVSQPLMTLVDDSRYWIVANYKETQVGNLKIGGLVELKIDAFPAEKLEGKIVSISESTGAKTSLLPPDNSSGNFVKVSQRVPVKIEILNYDKVKHLLKAGLSLEVSASIK